MTFFLDFFPRFLLEIFWIFRLFCPCQVHFGGCLGLGYHFPEYPPGPSHIPQGPHKAPIDRFN
jgi:hypothetical protein